FGYGGFFNPTEPTKQLYGPNAPTGDTITSIVASQIYNAGSTSIATFDASLGGSLPVGYTQSGALSYDITTTSEASGPHTVTFSVSSVSDQTAFSNLRIFHLEQDPYDPGGFVWIDRTVL